MYQHKGDLWRIWRELWIVDVHFPWWIFSQFSGAKKFLELQNFHWPKITCFFFCVKFRLVSGGRPCVQFIRGLFAIFSSELFSKGKELAGELKSHELLDGSLLNCLFFNSLAGILPGHVKFHHHWVHPRWLLVVFLSLGWSRPSKLMLVVEWMPRGRLDMATTLCPESFGLCRAFWIPSVQYLTSNWYLLEVESLPKPQRSGVIESNWSMHQILCFLNRYDSMTWYELGPFAIWPSVGHFSTDSVQISAIWRSFWRTQICYWRRRHESIPRPNISKRWSARKLRFFGQIGEMITPLYSQVIRTLLIVTHMFSCIAKDVLYCIFFCDVSPIGTGGFQWVSACCINVLEGTRCK